MIRRILFPATQLISAGLAFVAWAYLSYAAAAPYQDIPIHALAYAAPLSLTLTLGLTYLFPNKYRGIDLSRRSQRGPWSNELTACAFTSIAAILVGGFLSALTSDPTWLTVATVLALSGLFSIGIVCAQVGRATTRLRLALFGATAAPVPPIAWAVLNDLGVLAKPSARMVCALCAIVGLAIAFNLRQALLPPALLNWSLLRSDLAQSLPLVPHLLSFGVLVQGIRLTASWSESADLLLIAHKYMLGASIGLTSLASFNSFFTVVMQSQGDGSFRSSLRTALRRYVQVGFVSCALVLIATLIVQMQVETATDQSAAIPLLLTAAVLNVAFYYSLSAQLIRLASTTSIAVASSLAVVVFFLAFFLAVPADSIVGQSFGYAAATSLLPLTLLLFDRFTSRSLARGAAVLYPLVLVPAATVTLLVSR